MTEPVASYGGLSWWGNFGEYAFCTRLRAEQLRDLGPALSPFNAFLLLQGLETLPQRMDAHLANARAVAEFLAGAPGGGRGCAGPACPTTRDHERAQRYLPSGPGAVFVVRRARRARGRARRFIESVELCSHLANIGDARTLVIHPASTTHQQLSDEALVAAGVPARPGPHLGRHRGRRRHHVGPRPGARARRRRPSAMTRRDGHAGCRRRCRPASGSADPAARPATVGHPRHVDRPQPGRATSSPPTCCRRAARSSTCGSSTRRAATILGQPVYPSLADAARHPRPRRRVPPRRGPAGRRRGGRRHRRHPRRSGASSGSCRTRRRRIAHAAGRNVVMNRCLKIEHARFAGGLHLAGFDTGVISSRRRPDL